VIELAEDAFYRAVGIRDRALGVVLPLLRETFSMFLEFLAIEIGEALTEHCLIRDP
jgi:hypothetical protein